MAEIEEWTKVGPLVKDSTNDQLMMEQHILKIAFDYRGRH
jgi:hypothetical protein